MSKYYTIGVDEAGRGPWAGPVSAGVFLVEDDFDFDLLPGLTDSKRLSHERREILFAQIEILKSMGKCDFAYAESSSLLIDQVGIREANRLAMESALLELFARVDIASIGAIQIDGRDNYEFSGISSEKLEYIVRGDLSHPVISAASIIAKVLRDRKMCDFHEKHPSYSFHLHKGYGTRKHQQELMSYGITPLHRKSYAPVKRLISGDS